MYSASGEESYATAAVCYMWLSIVPGFGTHNLHPAKAQRAIRDPFILSAV
jgi:hypothetical protein